VETSGKLPSSSFAFFGVCSDDGRGVAIAVGGRSAAVLGDRIVSSKYSVELFLEACGATGPLHLGVEDSSRPGGPLRRVLHQPFVVIGRDPTTDLLLASRRVSRRHAYLQLVGGRLFCVDLGSRTGTEWDDGSFDSGWLESTRFIRVGPYVINLWDDANRFAAVEAPDDFSAGFTICLLYTSDAADE